jgi:Beta-ketoacyl synthase, N-terminal domain
MMRVFVEGVGLAGPGLCGWLPSRAILTGGEAYQAAATIVTGGDLLPPTERRRTPVPVKLALAVGHEALMNSGRAPETVATVFSSSSGDGVTLHQICETLASPAREVSPTRFHNSVHNAAAGYWGISTRSHEASTSLSCYDACFAAGLLEAAVQIAGDGIPVALIAYDEPYPEPLHAARPLGASFGAALVLAAGAGANAIAMLEVEFVPGATTATRMSDPGLDAARHGIPAARSLPLLAALARGASEEIVFDFPPHAHLRVAVTPCG